jgi:hypothetical protein
MEESRVAESLMEAILCIQYQRQSTVQHTVWYAQLRSDVINSVRTEWTSSPPPAWHVLIEIAIPFPCRDPRLSVQ